MSRTLISSGSRFESEIAYSRAVVDGNTVFVSGTTGYDYRSGSISDSVTEQAEQCFRNIETALVEAGSTLEDIVRIRYIFPDREDFKPCWPIFQKHLGETRPAATMLVAGLLEDAMKLEIEVTAKIRLTES